MTKHEARCISNRTRDVLKQLKDSGEVLGNPNAAKAAKLAPNVNSETAARVADIRPLD